MNLTGRLMSTHDGVLRHVWQKGELGADQNRPRKSRVPGRFELVDAGQDFTVIVDYAHTPDMTNVLKTARSFTENRISRYSAPVEIGTG